MSAVSGPGAFVANQGGAWEVLFTPALEQTPPGAEAHRRNAALSVREPEQVIELGMWPEHPRPRLGQMRRLFLPRRADDVLFFRDSPPGSYYRYRWIWH